MRTFFTLENHEISDMTMTNGELNILHRHPDASVRYLEFGAGASSIIRIDSVDSSRAHIDKNLKSHPIISDAISKKSWLSM